LLNVLQTRYLGLSGGTTVGEATRNIMKRLLTSAVAVQCNWKGKGDKHAFGKGVIKQVVCGKWQHWIYCCLLKTRYKFKGTRSLS